MLCIRLLRGWLIAVGHYNEQAELGKTRANHWILQLPDFYTILSREAGGGGQSPIDGN